MSLLVSIIIPNFNKGNYIAQTLDSLSIQTYKNWEAIIVDDGSTDSSLMVIDSYCKKDSRFRLLKRDREIKGGSTCRNIGLEEAFGDYIIFLDSDDLFIKTTLRERVEAFLKYPDNNFLVFPMGTFKKEIGDSSSVWKPSRNGYLKKFLLHKIQWTITSPIWQKEFLLQLNGFDEEFPRLQDVELHTRALMVKDVSYKVFRDTKPDCFYRIDEDRIVDDYPEFIKKWTDGVIMYNDKMSNLIKNSKSLDNKLLKYIKGTIISMISQILYSSKVNKISIDDKNKLIKKLLNNLKLLSKTENLLINLYIKGYELGFYRIKGFNYISKKLIVLI